MKLEIEHLQRIAVVSVTGGLIGEESEELIRTVEKVLESGTRRFIFDLSESGEIDSKGIGSVMAVFTAVAQRGGSLVMVGPNSFSNGPPPESYPGTPLFKIYRTREDAIDALLKL
jgi:anti-anti-sigma factor